MGRENNMPHRAHCLLVLLALAGAAGTLAHATDIDAAVDVLLSGEDAVSWDVPLDGEPLKYPEGLAPSKVGAGRKLQARQSGPLAKGGGRGPGSGGSNAGSAIAWGQYALNSDFPYIAPLFNSRGAWEGCGGSLIRPRLVVTAAHCVVTDSLVPYDVKYVAVGLLSFQTDKSTDYEYIRVTKIVRHASYKPMTSSARYANDIAVLVLERAARTKPVKLAAATFALKPVDTQPSTGDWLYPAGWGGTEANRTALHLMFAYMPYVSVAKCTSMFKSVIDAPFPSTHLCAGCGGVIRKGANLSPSDPRNICSAYGNARQEVCQGDSGGPLVKATSTGDILVGISSFKISGLCGHQPALSAFTSVMRMRSWIDGQIKTLRV